jgi:hypothetical protein
MPFRLFSIAVVLFWMGSVAWLCAVVWAPPGSRMAKIDPREVYAVFFAWNESTTMTLLENGVRRGQITVSGGSGTDAESGEFERFFSVAGSSERFDERSGSPLVEFFWKGTFSFTEAMESRGGEFTARIPERELNAHLEFEAPPSPGAKPVVRARVEMAGNELFSFDPEATPGLDPAAALSMMGPVAGLSGLGSLNPADLKLTTEARVGSFNLAGREMRAFLLTLRGAEPDQTVRVYLSEAGEPLRIETDLGFEAVSEILVPLEAYQRQNSANRDD